MHRDHRVRGTRLRHSWGLQNFCELQTLLGEIAGPRLPLPLVCYVWVHPVSSLALCQQRLGSPKAEDWQHRLSMQALNITAEQFSSLLSAHNLTREQFIHLYGLWPLVYTPELPARAKLAFALAGALIFALALFGNSLVVYVVTRSKAMHTVTNIFICSLALSDLLIAFCIPVTMLQNISDKWLGGTTGIACTLMETDKDTHTHTLHSHF